MPFFYQKKYTLSFILFFSLIVAAKAQYSDDYTPIKSSGAIPEEFLKSAKALSMEETRAIVAGKDHDAKTQFTISQNYFLQNLLLSGDVLFNDPLSVYVNKVADELLKDNASLRQQLHIYVVKRPEVDAFAFDKGFVFVNIGLLAQLENEAQLAYVLSHEITHITKHHSITEYIENIKLNNGTSDYEDGSENDRNLAKYKFSKEQESEADVEGLKLFKESKYSVKTVSGAFDVLQYSYLPFELADFKKSFFEENDMTLPDTLILKKTQEVKSNDDYDDTKSTHPNIRKRRGSIESDLKMEDESSRKKYLVSEDEFKKTRENARFELCRLYQRDRDYVNAIYAAYLLLEKYPNNLFLHKTISKALYNISVNKSNEKNRNSTNITDDSKLSSKRYSIPDYTKIEGPSQRVYYMLDNLSAKELNVVAINYVYKAHKKYPSDKTLSSLTDSLFAELVFANDLYPNDFSRKTKKEIKEDASRPVVKDSTDGEESKYSKIKKQQQQVEMSTDENFIKYALVDEFKDADFAKRYSEIAKGNSKKVEIETSTSLNKKHSRDKNNDVPLLGIDKVIFIPPYYSRVEYKDGDDFVNFYESEERQKWLLDVEKKCANQLKLSFAEVNTVGISSGDLEKFNDNAVVNEWIETRFRHGNNSDEVIENAESIKQLIDKLGSKYLAWGGVANVKGRSYKNTYFFLVFNLESGEVMKYETQYARTKDYSDMVTSLVYNSLMHVSKKPKPE